MSASISHTYTHSDVFPLHESEIQLYCESSCHSTLPFHGDYASTGHDVWDWCVAEWCSRIPRSRRSFLTLWIERICQIEVIGTRSWNSESVECQGLVVVLAVCFYLYENKWKLDLINFVLAELRYSVFKAPIPSWLGLLLAWSVTVTVTGKGWWKSLLTTLCSTVTTQLINFISRW